MQLHRTGAVLLTLMIPAGLSASDRPNLIVIFTDDHGYADLGCQGVLEDVETPHIDMLAEGGVLMTSGYVTAPQCVPSQAGLLTGRYQNRLGVESNGEPLDGFNAEQTIAARLKARLTKWADELNPPGLATREMASTWERYFDYYLEGKPAPAPASGRSSKSGRGSR